MFAIILLLPRAIWLWHFRNQINVLLPVFLDFNVTTSGTVWARNMWKKSIPKISRKGKIDAFLLCNAPLPGDYSAVLWIQSNKNQRRDCINFTYYLGWENNHHVIWIPSENRSLYETVFNILNINHVVLEGNEVSIQWNANQWLKNGLFIFHL